MDRSRTAVLIAAATVSIAAAAFAFGAALTSDDDEPAAAATTIAPAAAAVTSAPAAGATFDVEISGFKFGPAEAVVAVGTTVTWTNNDTFEHTVQADGDAFPTSPTLGEGATYSFTFTEPGTYAYICGIHPQMRGTVVVEG